MKAFRFGDTLYQIRHGPPILARNSFSIWSSCCVCPIYPAWYQGSGMLHVLDCCGQTEDCRETGRFGGNKVEDSGDVGGETRVGMFAPSSIWCSPWLRESSVILLVIHCMLRNNGSHQFDQSSIAVVMHLDLLLLWTESAKKNLNLARWKLIIFFSQCSGLIDVLFLDTLTLKYWDFLILDETGGRCFMCYLGVSNH